MGHAVEKRIDDAIRSLIERDSDMAQAVIDGDRTIDQMEMRLDDDCVQIRWPATCAR